jgi:uncharacterized membrane protein (GlpM family)
MNYLQLLLKFVIGGGTIVGATLLAKYVNPKWAGLLVAAPIASVLAFIFISMENELPITQKYLASSMCFMVPAFLFLLGIFISSYRFNLGMSFAFGSLIFILSTLVLQSFI